MIRLLAALLLTLWCAAPAQASDADQLRLYLDSGAVADVFPDLRLGDSGHVADAADALRDRLAGQTVAMPKPTAGATKAGMELVDYLDAVLSPQRIDALSGDEKKAWTATLEQLARELREPVQDLYQVLRSPKTRLIDVLKRHAETLSETNTP